MPAPQNPKIENALTFSAPELAQLEAFAALHGESVAAFVQRVALDAAHITSTKERGENSPSDRSAL